MFGLMMMLETFGINPDQFVTNEKQIRIGMTASAFAFLLAICAHFDRGKKPSFAGWAITLSVVVFLVITLLLPEA